MNIKSFFKMWVWVITLMLTNAVVVSAQKQPVVGDVKLQSEVFDFPIWKHLRQGQRDSAVAMTWEDYLGIDTIFAWNAVEKLMARFTRFSGKDSILVVTLDNEEDAIYRKKCKNRNKRPMDPTPKGGEDCPTWEMIFIYLPCPEKEKPVTPPPPPPPCENCCPGDSVVYKVEFYASHETERIGGELVKSFGGGVEWMQNYLHRNDKDQPWIEQPVGFYAGLVAYLASQGIEFKPTCDTCGYWGPIPGGIAFHSDVYFGIQHRLFKRYGVFGFAEMRYSWFNTEHRRNKFFSDEGMKVRGGLRVKFETSRKFPIFRSVQVELGPQASTYATPAKKLAIGGGGFLELRANFGARDKEVRDAEHAKRMKRAQAQFVRDSTAREQRIMRDSIVRAERDSIEEEQQAIQDSLAVETLILESPKPIVLDSTEMSFEPIIAEPNAKGSFNEKFKRTDRLNMAKLKVSDLILQQNELKQQVLNGDNAKRAPLAKNIRELKEAKKDLKRKQKKFDRKSNTE